MIQALQTALSGLTAIARTVQTTAHNVANVATPAFKRVRSQLQETEDGGVQASASQDQQPGPQVFRETTNGWTLKEQSNVDVGEEMVNLSLARREFEFNASVIATTDQMLGSLLDIRK
jgi:flagellar basal-body rod protein FlgC